jgi:DNA-binding SARP family transcriptional activator
MGPLVRVRLLGPVDVVADDGPCEPRTVSGLRRTAVLAALALRGGEIIGTDQLTDIVWGEAAPPTAVNTLQKHVSYLRNVLGSKAAIRARPPGYVLDLGGDGTDVRLAERLLRQGTQAADPGDGARQLRSALVLWRGRPLGDVTGLAWLDDQARRLELLNLQVRRALVEAMLAAGDHVQAVPDLEQLVADHPLDEQIHAQLMLALYRSGRQADALAAFHRLRHTLGEELGIVPSPALRELETAILLQDAALAAPTPAIALAARQALPPVTQEAPVPAQLPSAIPGFAGRGAELAGLDAILAGTAGAAGAGPGGRAAVAISVVSGSAGVGKTALAIHWAHRVRAQFPDGQLHVNLRGFDPGGQPLNPAEAVRGFLDAFGVPVARIPEGLPAQAALYRSLLDGKRVLVVLDNARDAGQVRPLLPGSPGCLVIVTSRDHLTGLVATEGAVPLGLDLLTAAEARDLLTLRLGQGRVAAEPGAVSDIIAGCARLPLALTIAAARAAASPAFPLAVLAAELREAGRTLDHFDGGEPATDVRAVFSWSYRALSSDAARLFRLLGLSPGPDIAVAAAVSLAAIAPARARALLRELTRAHLLAEHVPGRYAFHDLLRAYAAEQARLRDSQAVRDAALHRLLGHYLHTAYAAARILKPERDPIDLAELPAGTAAEGLSTFDSAWEWLTAEHQVLLACARESAAAGLDRHAWQLAWAMKTYLYRRGHWQELVTTESTAADAARRGGDLPGLGTALFSLAEACVRLNRLDEAESCYRQALEVHAATGDLSGEADLYLGLSELAAERHRLADALGFARQALDKSRRAGDLTGQALALNSIGCSHAQLGEYHQALAPCREALVLLQDLGFRESEAGVWNSLGQAHHGLADHRQAAICFQRAIDLYSGLGDRYWEADTLALLGDVRHSAGDIIAARRSWAQALRIFDEIDHPDGDRVRAKLQLPAGAEYDSPYFGLPVEAQSAQKAEQAPGDRCLPGMRQPDPCYPANAGISTSTARYVTLCRQASDIRHHA